MTSDDNTTKAPLGRHNGQSGGEEKDRAVTGWKWRWRFGGGHTTQSAARSSFDTNEPKRPVKYSFGVLNDKETDEVPGRSFLTHE